MDIRDPFVFWGAAATTVASEPYRGDANLVRLLVEYKSMSCSATDSAQTFIKETVKRSSLRIVCIAADVACSCAPD